MTDKLSKKQKKVTTQKVGPYLTTGVGPEVSTVVINSICIFIAARNRPHACPSG